MKLKEKPIHTNYTDREFLVWIETLICLICFTSLQGLDPEFGKKGVGENIT